MKISLFAHITIAISSTWADSGCPVERIFGQRLTTVVLANMYNELSADNNCQLPTADKMGMHMLAS